MATAAAPYVPLEVAPSPEAAQAHTEQFPQHYLSTGQRARVAVGGTLVFAGTTCALLQTRMELSREAKIGTTAGLWGGILGGLSIALPAPLRSTCQTISVVCRRVLGTAVAMAGAFAVDAQAQTTGNFMDASYLGLATFFVGCGIAFGPETYRCTSHYVREIRSPNPPVEQPD